MRQRGFTLVELVVVITLLAIIALGSTRFIIQSVEGYGDTVRRDSVAGAARLAINRITRELRNALPNSPRVRTGGNSACLEFIPVVSASVYQTLPTITASTAFSSIPFNSAPQTGRVAVYPINTAPLYQLSANSPISQQPVVTPAADLVATDTAVTVQLGAAHRFPLTSPSDRYFMVASPVSFCVQGSDLYRYQNYGFNSTQPLPADLPDSEPNRALLAQGLDSGSGFSVLPPGLRRNGLALLDLLVTDQGETLRIQHEVQIRNAP